jgi:trigger factor
LAEESNNNDGTEDTRKYIYDARGNKIFLNDKQKELDKPKIDDRFAQKLGAKDLEDLKRIVRTDLEQIMSNNVEAKFENEIFDQLIKLSDVDVPDILIDDELNRMIIRLERQLQEQGQKLEDYLKQQNTTFDALKAKWRPDAEKIAKINLIVEDIGKAEKVKVDDTEIESAKKTVDNSNMDESQKAQLDLYLISSIFQAKTLDLIKKSAAS